MTCEMGHPLRSQTSSSSAPVEKGCRSVTFSADMGAPGTWMEVAKVTLAAWRRLSTTQDSTSASSSNTLYAVPPRRLRKVLMVAMLVPDAETSAVSVASTPGLSWCSTKRVG